MTCNHGRRWPKSRRENDVGSWSHGPIGLAECRSDPGEASATAIQPLIDHAHKIAIVWDGRLDNRDEILASIEGPGVSAQASDAALVLQAYHAWGRAALNRLDGDFAFAIWEADRRHLFAARDPFPVKPFFYYVDDRRFAFGSEPKQLLVLPGVEAEPDDVIIGEHLLDHYETSDRTFFRGTC